MRNLTNKTQLKLAAATIGMGLLAACGGGSGGGGGGGDPGNPGALTSLGQLALSASNQDAVAQEVATTLFGVAGSSDSLIGAQSFDEQAAYRLAFGKASQAARLFQNVRANESQTGASVTQTVNCSGGGKMTLNATDADNNQSFSAGDLVTMSYAQCIEYGVTTNGSTSIRYTHFSGDLYTSYFSLTAKMEFANLTSSVGSSSFAMNGQTTVNVTSAGDRKMVMSVETPSLNMTSILAGAAPRTRTVQNYTTAATLSPYGGYGTQSSTVAGGRVISSSLTTRDILFATPAPFVQYDTADNPHAGVLVVTGAGGSTLRLTVQSAQTVLQELDANGDGVYESSKSVPWSALK